jgi:hypothetical protein
MASPARSRRPTSEHAIDALLWGLTIASALVTLWLSLGPVPPGAGAFPGADKVFHALAYFVTTLLLLLAAVWRPVRGPGPLARLAWALILAIVASGLVVEVLQGALTAKREPELGDWLADAAGVLTASLVHLMVRQLFGARATEAEEVSA